MIIFIWRSKAMEAYGQGWIITTAPSLPIARAKATLSFDAWYAKEHEERFGFPLDEGNADDVADREKFLAQIMVDLEAVPEEHPAVSQYAIFIRGSE